MKGFRTVFLAGVTFVLNAIAFFFPGLEGIPEEGSFAAVYDQFIILYDTILLPLVSVWLRTKTDTPIFIGEPSK